MRLRNPGSCGAAPGCDRGADLGRVRDGPVGGAAAQLVTERAEHGAEFDDADVPGAAAVARQPWPWRDLRIDAHGDPAATRPDSVDDQIGPGREPVHRPEGQ